MGSLIIIQHFSLGAAFVKHQLDLAGINYLAIEPDEEMNGTRVVIVDSSQPGLSDLLDRLRLLSFFSQLPA